MTDSVARPTKLVIEIIRVVEVQKNDRVFRLKSVCHLEAPTTDLLGDRQKIKYALEECHAMWVNKQDADQANVRVVVNAKQTLDSPDDVRMVIARHLDLPDEFRN